MASIPAHPIAQKSAATNLAALSGLAGEGTTKAAAAGSGDIFAAILAQLAQGPNNAKPIASTSAAATLLKPAQPASASLPVAAPAATFFKSALPASTSSEVAVLTATPTADTTQTPQDMFGNNIPAHVMAGFAQDKSPASENQPAAQPSSGTGTARPSQPAANTEPRANEKPSDAAISALASPTMRPQISNTLELAQDFHAQHNANANIEAAASNRPAATGSGAPSHQKAQDLPAAIVAGLVAPQLPEPMQRLAQLRNAQKPGANISAAQPAANSQTAKTDSAATVPAMPDKSEPGAATGSNAATGWATQPPAGKGATEAPAASVLAQAAQQSARDFNAQGVSLHALPIDLGTTTTQKADHSSREPFAAPAASQAPGSEGTADKQASPVTRSDTPAPAQHDAQTPSGPAVQPVQTAAHAAAPEAAAPTAATATQPQAPAPVSANLQVADQTRDVQSAPQPNTATLAVAIAAKSQSGARHFDIRLDPPELGRVDVRLSVDDSGKAQAHLSVEKPQTLDFLQRDSRNLERTLKDSGLDLSNNGLNFSLKGQDRQNDRSGAPTGRSRSLSVRAIAGLDASQTNISTASLAPNSVSLDIRV